MAAADPVPAKLKYKDWQEGDAWPKEIPRRVRNKQAHGQTIFYNGTRIREGKTFTLLRPQDFSDRTMAAAPGQPDDQARQLREAGHDPKNTGRRTNAKSSADLTKSSKLPDVPEDVDDVAAAAEAARPTSPAKRAGDDRL